MRLGAKEIHWTSVGEREGDAGELSGRKKAIWQKKSYLAEKESTCKKSWLHFSTSSPVRVFSLAKLKYGKPRLGESTLT